MAATYLGAWIVLVVAVIYGPVLIGALADPTTAAKVEGLNYFADTLLFGGAILSLACTMTGSE
jgi:ABC-type antimicrobial peptide transport system permease subunit